MNAPARVVLVGRFAMGQIVATPGALEVLGQLGIEPLTVLRRHSKGDWGDVCDEDSQTNERSLVSGARLLSSYRLGPDPDARKVWVITDADRSSTCILLPEEY